MNSNILTTDADISRALLLHVVNPFGERPRLDITTPKAVFLLVTVEQPILPRMQDGELLFISFFGKDPMGRQRLFIWPPIEVEEPALGITELRVCGG